MIKAHHIHQIELTSRCNLRCVYCPSPNLPRPKMDMTEDTWRRTLNWVQYFHAANGGTRELNLCGIGESTLHPELVRYTFEARAVVGPDCFLNFTTNGLLITDELARALAPSGVKIGVSLHRPEKAGPAIEVLKRHGLLFGISADPSAAAINWAGQVDWHVSAMHRECMWVKGGLLFVMADGRVSRCCLDASGVGVIGSVHEDVAQFETSPYVLCRTCDQDVGVPIPEEVSHERPVPLKFMSRAERIALRESKAKEVA